MKLDRVLVPLDGSKLAEAAIETALSLTRGEPSSTLLLLRAAEAHAFPGADPTDEQVEAIHEAEVYLSDLAERLRRRGITQVETGVWYGPAARTIIQAARLKKADLIVMSTHGRSGLGRIILGSVTELVLRGTTTPICVVRSSRAPIETPPGLQRSGDRETSDASKAGSAS
jgi:nucleotide-binding universal stress UspA family protein